MRVFRGRHSLGCVALLAFAMQATLALALTHAHTHRHAGFAGGLETRAITYGACRASAQRPCPLLVPHDDDSKCPICWSVSLATSAVPQPPPVVSFHPPQFDAPPPARVVAVAYGNETVHFQARAPPHLSA
jgi:hypothetical protein